jgi:XPB/Ssl2-like helicase family protein
MGRSATTAQSSHLDESARKGDNPDAGAHVGDLSALGEKELARLLTLRPDLADPPPRTLAALTERSMSVDSVTRALADADLFVHQVVEALAVVGERHTTVEHLLRVFGDIPRGDLLRALDYLDERGLVARQGSDLCVHGRFLAIRRPAGLGPPALPLVESRSVNELRFIATTLGLDPRGAKRKAQLVAHIMQVLDDPAAVRTLVAAAPSAVRTAAMSMAKGSPVIQLPWNHASTAYSRGTKERDQRPDVWLLQRGLMQKEDWYSGVMPREVGLALRDGRAFPEVFNRPPELTARPVLPSETHPVHERVVVLVGALERLIDAWGSSPASLLKKGGVGVRDVRRLAGILEMPERESFRMVELAGAAGLVVCDPSRQVALPTTAADEWLDLDVADRWLAVALGWLHTSSYISLAGALDQQGKAIPAFDYDPLWESHAMGQRRAVLGSLSRLPEANGVAPDVLTAVLAWSAPVLWQKGPASPLTLVTWTMAEMELLGLLSGGALTPLGVALVREDVNEARRLLRDTSASEWQLVLQADLTALVHGQIPATVRAELDLLADVEARGAATVYRFSESSARRAFDAGRTATEINDFLARHATKGVPQPLTYLVGDVARRHGQVRLGSTCSYVRFEDPALAIEVARAKRTEKLEFQQIAPTVLVSDHTADKVLAVLRGAGYMPVQESGQGAVVRAPIGRQRAACPGEDAGRWQTRLSAVPTGHNPDVARRDSPREVVTSDASTRDGDHYRELAAALLSAVDDEPAQSYPVHRRPDPASPTPRLFALPSPPGLQDEMFDELRELMDSMGADGVGDGDRPTQIFRSRPDIVDILLDAYNEDWLVRLSYTSSAGKTKEVTVAVSDVDAASVTVEVAPRWTTQTYVLDRISWARVLTEAEENVL